MINERNYIVALYALLCGFKYSKGRQSSYDAIHVLQWKEVKVVYQQ